MPFCVREHAADAVCLNSIKHEATSSRQCQVRPRINIQRSARETDSSALTNRPRTAWVSRLPQSLQTALPELTSVNSCSWDEQFRAVVPHISNCRTHLPDLHLLCRKDVSERRSATAAVQPVPTIPHNPADEVDGHWHPLRMNGPSPAVG